MASRLSPSSRSICACAISSCRTPTRWPMAAIRLARPSCARSSWIFRMTPMSRIFRDEYMFGPAFLVAPVSEQGATSRKVYLPAGSDWYNYWTNERIKGGQTITAAAPIDTLPLFVRAGSIVPLGAAVLNALATADHCFRARLPRSGCGLHSLFR